MMAVDQIGAPPGSFMIVIGDDDAKRRLLRAEDAIDDWLYELIDAFAFEAASRLRHHAPGAIDLLVDVELAHQVGPGAFEAAGGVEPYVVPWEFHRGLGSDPADYPVYVDQGTGIFGEKRSPITTIPGHVMGPIWYKGRRIYVQSFKGQPAQHFSDQSYTDMLGWTPMQIELALPELERKIDT
jgi:hypothetical protein